MATKRTTANQIHETDPAKEMVASESGTEALTQGQSHESPAQSASAEQPAQDADVTPDQGATEKTKGEPEASSVECAVLHDSIYGKHDSIIELPADQAEAAASAGYVDTHPNAIAAIRGRAK